MTQEETKTATITFDGKSYAFPLVTGTMGEMAIEISKLRSQTGIITLDDGFQSTGSCRSSITFLDGEKGILRYRGYPIERLAEKSCFLDVAHLLFYGELPDDQRSEFIKKSVATHAFIHEDMRRIFTAYPPDAHPMAIVSSVVCSLSTFYQDVSARSSPEAMDVMMTRLLGKLPTIIAFAYRHSRGMTPIYPSRRRSYAENFLTMMFGWPEEPYTVDPEIARALDVLLILHADHEQNCSTSTVRMVGSAETNLFASISAGINALWGALHGGANQRVVEMLEHIAASGGDVRSFIDRVKDKKQNVRLMGFGHRVYKNFDPRATIIKGHCETVLKKLRVKDSLLDIARELEDIALHDSYFIERKLYPNVDFYSGLIYKAMGFPTNMFTVLFAMGRLPGWMAHWKEMVEAGSRISRPRQIYTGVTDRNDL